MLIMGGQNYKADESAIIKQSSIGAGSTIDKDCVVIKSRIGQYVDIEKRNLIRDSQIGDMSYTGADTSIMWAEVGKYCCISRMVDIGGNEHNYENISMMPSYRMQNKLNGKIMLHHDEEKICIGNDVWIGAGAVILRKEGLCVGDGAVIGAGAVVTKSVPPYAIVAGVPARVIRYRFSESMIEKLLALAWWGWDFEKVREHLEVLNSLAEESTVNALLRARSGN